MFDDTGGYEGNPYGKGRFTAERITELNSVSSFAMFDYRRISSGSLVWGTHWWLVGGVVSTPLTNMKVSWDDDITNWMGKWKRFQSTNQLVIKCGWLENPPCIAMNLHLVGGDFPVSSLRYRSASTTCLSSQHIMIQYIITTCSCVLVYSFMFDGVFTTNHQLG